GWDIDFSALPHLLQTGNEPLRLFRELQQLGRLEVLRIFLVDGAPAQLADFDPTTCYLGWQLRLHGDVARADVDAVFDWLDGDCVLAIKALEAAPVAVANDAAPVAPAAVSAAPAAGAKVAVRDTASASSEGSSIRVGIDKVDALINMMGEL